MLRRHQVECSHPGAVGGERLGDRLADAPRRAGDHGHPTGQALDLDHPKPSDHPIATAATTTLA